MGIEPKKTDYAKLQEHLNKEIQRHIRNLSRVGEEFVNDARLGGSYRDQTGNLRSSIGYAIGYDGKKEKASNSQPIKGGKEGQSKGEAFGEELIAKAPQSSITLVGFAGMDYAGSVEARGKDVITWSTKRAIRRIKAIMKK
jgi:hypothetical protein